MHIAFREKPYPFEGSKKELSLKTTKLSGNENIKQTLSESGPESLLASHGKYARTRTFAVGQAKRAVLAYSEEKQRVDGFVMNKDQQLVPIKPHDLPKELREILNSEAFEAFLKDIHARLTELSNSDFRLALHQGLKGGVYSENGDTSYIKQVLQNISEGPEGRRYQSKIIIENKCEYPLELIHQCVWGRIFYTNHPHQAFHNEGNSYKIYPGAAGGIVCNGIWSLPESIEGYMAIRISTLEKDYTVICAFRAGFLSANLANIKISAQPKTANELGEIVDHSFNTSGLVNDRNELFPERPQHDKRLRPTLLNIKTNMFHVRCKFNNDKKASFYFGFTQPKAKKKDEKNERNYTD